MDKNKFLELLQIANLSKKEFAALSKVSYGTVSNWSEDRPVPDWVESWLELYIDNKECKELKQLLRDTVCDKR